MRSLARVYTFRALLYLPALIVASWTKFASVNFADSLACNTAAINKVKQILLLRCRVLAILSAIWAYFQKLIVTQCNFVLLACDNLRKTLGNHKFRLFCRQHRLYRQVYLISQLESLVVVQCLSLLMTTIFALQHLLGYLTTQDFVRFAISLIDFAYGLLIHLNQGRHSTLKPFLRIARYQLIMKLK